MNGKCLLAISFFACEIIAATELRGPPVPIHSTNSLTPACLGAALAVQEKYSLPLLTRFKVSEDRQQCVIEAIQDAGKAKTTSQSLRCTSLRKTPLHLQCENLALDWSNDQSAGRKRSITDNLIVIASNTLSPSCLNAGKAFLESRTGKPEGIDIQDGVDHCYVSIGSLLIDVSHDDATAFDRPADMLISTGGEGCVSRKTHPQQLSCHTDR